MKGLIVSVSEIITHDVVVKISDGREYRFEATAGDYEREPLFTKMQDGRLVKQWNVSTDGTKMYLSLGKEKITARLYPIKPRGVNMQLVGKTADGLKVKVTANCVL